MVWNHANLNILPNYAPAMGFTPGIAKPISEARIETALGARLGIVTAGQGRLRNAKRSCSSHVIPYFRSGQQINLFPAKHATAVSLA